MQDILTSLSTYGYIILFLYSLGGGFVALVAAGVLSYTGKMDISISIFVAFMANFIGDTILFYMSRYNKSQVVPYLKKHRRKLALSHILMKRHGDKIIFFQKFVYGIKTLIPLAIGLTKYDIKKFTILNFVSALAWAVIIGIASYTSGKYLMAATEYVSEHVWIAPMILFSMLFLLWYYFHAMTKRK